MSELIYNKDNIKLWAERTTISLRLSLRVHNQYYEAIIRQLKDQNLDQYFGSFHEIVEHIKDNQNQLQFDPKSHNLIISTKLSSNTSKNKPIVILGVIHFQIRSNDHDAQDNKPTKEQEEAELHEVVQVCGNELKPSQEMNRKILENFNAKVKLMLDERKVNKEWRENMEESVSKLQTLIKQSIKNNNQETAKLLISQTKQAQKNERTIQSQISKQIGIPEYSAKIQQMQNRMLIDLKQQMSQQKYQSDSLSQRIKTIMKLGLEICSVKVVEEHRKYIIEFDEFKSEHDGIQANFEKYVRFMAQKYMLFKSIGKFYVTAVHRLGYTQQFNKNMHNYQGVLTDIGKQYNTYVKSQHEPMSVEQLKYILTRLIAIVSYSGQNILDSMFEVLLKYEQQQLMNVDIAVAVFIGVLLVIIEQEYKYRHHQEQTQVKQGKQQGGKGEKQMQGMENISNFQFVQGIDQNSESIKTEKTKLDELMNHVMIKINRFVSKIKQTL